MKYNLITNNILLLLSRYFFLDAPISINKITLKISRVKIIQELTLLYGLLMDHNDIHNLLFFYLVVYSLMVYVVYTGYTIFATYLIWAHYTETVSYNVILKNVVMISHFTYRWITCANRIHDMIDKSKILATQIHRALNLQANFECTGMDTFDFVNFSQLLLLRKPKANFFIFDFNWPLLNSIFGAIVGYLIILIQFDNPKLLCGKVFNVTRS